jgi:hypothetical protein
VVIQEIQELDRVVVEDLEVQVHLETLEMLLLKVREILEFLELLEILEILLVRWV